MNYAEESLKLHYALRGKIEMTARTAVDSTEALALAYTPGVAQPCLEIQKDVSKSYELTRRWNTVAVVTDGTAVLGLGDIGPEAGMPVMEGKCVLFKAFGGVDAFPLCIKTKDVDEFVNTVHLLSGSFGGINLEDIAAPRCFEIEKKLKEKCDIPIFHNNGGAVLVVVEDGNVALLLQLPLDLKAPGGGNILQIDAAEAAGHEIHRVDKLIYIVGLHAQREGVHAAEGLEQHALALHDGHAGLGADVPQPQHRAAVGDDGAQVMPAGQLVAPADILLNLQAGLGHAGGVGQGQVVGGFHRHPHRNLDFARPLSMKAEAFLCVIH